MSPLDSLECFTVFDGNGSPVTSRATFAEALLVLLAGEKIVRNGTLCVSDEYGWNDLAAVVFPHAGVHTHAEAPEIRELAHRNIAQHIEAAKRADGALEQLHFDAAKAWLAVAEAEAKLKTVHA